MKKMNLHRESVAIEGKTVKDLEESFRRSYGNMNNVFFEALHQWKVPVVSLGIMAVIVKKPSLC